MIFDPKKISSIIIAKGSGLRPPEGSKSGKDGDGHDYCMEGLQMSMSKFIEAVKNDDPKTASKCLQDWCKINKSYGEFTKPEESETYGG